SFSFVAFQLPDQTDPDDGELKKRKQVLQGVFLKEFLLKNITLKANFIDIYNNNVIINLGKEDFIKENQVFKHQNNYYRVKKVYPYTSFVELIQGKATNYTNSDIFIKVSR
ncbi:MAG: hypothetical protein ACK42K_12070, partial [Leptonema sp. (in: bacteria)]